MNWLVNLFTSHSIAGAVVILALTIAIGMMLNKKKFGSVSLGVTWVLFVGIILSHFGLTIDHEICHFIKEFGLILFVYSIGIQVGPSFISSLRDGGIKLNMLAVLIIGLGCFTCYIIHLITGEDLVTMVGVLSGAVTNTPGLGAAQSVVSSEQASTMATAYAVAYPLGVVGIILSMLIIRWIFRIKIDREAAKATRSDAPRTVRIDVRVTNRAIFGKTIEEISRIARSHFVVARIFDHENQQRIASGKTELQENDILRIVVSSQDVDLIQSLIGEVVKVDASEWGNASSHLEKRRILVTKSELNGKHIGDLHIRENYHVTITRVVRAGIELVATYELRLQMGDVVVVVGRANDLDQVSTILGNSVKRLDHPNLTPIFIGMFLGVLLGSIPIAIPGIPQAVKLGLAGGPLIVAILIAKYGPKYKLNTFTTNSANMMIREIGISLFLAAVGLGAGEGFINAIVNGGYWWILFGVIITLLPLIIVGVLARKAMKLDYFSLMGLMSGAMTDPPALAYANTVASNDRAAVAYATVYPLTMFLRIFTAQILALIALS
ncbi:MAG: putative transporter [Alistipes sp.]|nr:putative transporter [Alistipes sp.]